MNVRLRQLLVLTLLALVVLAILSELFRNNRLTIIKSDGELMLDLQLGSNDQATSATKTDNGAAKDNKPFVVATHEASAGLVETSNASPSKGMTYQQALQSVIKDKSDVLLALIDGGFLDMAMNFYETCIQAFKVENYLFIASDEKTCEHMRSLKVNCFVYKEDKDAGVASEYLSKAFLRKMNLRTDMIIDALQFNYAVLHTDIDMYCYKHPMQNINCKQPECDLAALQDTSVYNAGYIYVNPTAGSKAVYKKMQEIARKSPSIDDQNQLNMAIRQQRQADPKFVAKKLSAKEFLCGKYFYEDRKRYFAGKGPSCPECAIVHNNWIVSMEAKVYRERELHQWTYDGKDEYYSSTTRKYLQYSNPVIGNQGAAKQIESLRHALFIGHILNRTVILPVFNCVDRGNTYYDCPLNSLVSLDAFDKQFRGKYRESSFLQHPKVPNRVVENKSPTYIITSQYVVDNAKDIMTDETVQKIDPSNYTKGMTDEDVLKYFKDSTASVLHFTGLYDAFDRILDAQKHAEFSAKVKAGLQPSCYRQYNHCKKWATWLSIKL